MLLFISIVNSFLLLNSTLLPEYISFIIHALVLSENVFRRGEYTYAETKRTLTHILYQIQKFTYRPKCKKKKKKA